MSFYIKIANQLFEIKNIFPQIENLCKEYSVRKEDYCSVIEVTREKLVLEQYKYTIIKNRSDRYLIKKKLYELENTLIHREIVTSLIYYNIIMMHGVLICVGDSGYIFTAKSGTGKTTHAMKWLSNIPGSYIVNGDKPLLEIGDSVIGYGTPWCGKEGYNVNTSVTLKGICLLSRSETNSISEINFSSAFSRLINQVYIPDNETVKVISLLKKMSSSVKLYDLKCNISDEAAIMAYNFIKSCESE